jgi:hypothetical protein
MKEITKYTKIKLGDWVKAKFGSGEISIFQVTRIDTRIKQRKEIWGTKFYEYPKMREDNEEGYFLLRSKLWKLNKREQEKFKMELALTKI